MTYEIAICDDEEKQRVYIKSLVERWLRQTFHHVKNHYRIQFSEHYCRLKKRNTRRYFWKKEFRKIISENMDLHSAVRMY